MTKLNEERCKHSFWTYHFNQKKGKRWEFIILKCDCPRTPPMVVSSMLEDLEYGSNTPRTPAGQFGDFQCRCKKKKETCDVNLSFLNSPRGFKILKFVECHYSIVSSAKAERNRFYNTHGSNKLVGDCGDMVDFRFVFLSCVRASGRNEAVRVCERGVFVNAGPQNGNMCSLPWFAICIFASVCMF